jgi:hypothetical protein
MPSAGHDADGHVTENVDVRDLDQGYVSPDMSDPSVRGV